MTFATIETILPILRKRASGHLCEQGGRRGGHGLRGGERHTHMLRVPGERHSPMDEGLDARGGRALPGTGRRPPPLAHHPAAPSLGRGRVHLRCQHRPGPLQPAGQRSNLIPSSLLSMFYLEQCFSTSRGFPGRPLVVYGVIARGQ